MYSGDGKNGSRGGEEGRREGDALSNVQLLKRGNQSRQANSAAKTSLENTNMHHVSFMNAICFNLTLDEQEVGGGVNTEEQTDSGTSGEFLAGS